MGHAFYSREVIGDRAKYIVELKRLLPDMADCWSHKKLQFFKSYTEDGAYEVCNVVCYSDSLSIKIGLPRGLCIYLGHANQLAGAGVFYPKFENDKRCGVAALSDFANVHTASLTIKYSGSLGIVTLLPNGWTASSKNSASYADLETGGLSYAHQVAVVFEKRFSSQQCGLEKCLGVLRANGVLSFCGEFFLTCDQKHGYGYEDNGFVVTCAVRKNKDGAVEYLQPSELVALCVEANLPFSPCVKFENERAVKDLQSWTIKHCDILNVDSLRELNPVFADVHKKFVLGERVEGFVIRRYDSNGLELKSLKVKSWPYVLVTMVVRPLIQAGKPLLVEDNLSDTYKTKVLDAFQRWVIADDIKTRDLCFHFAAKIARGQGTVEEAPNRAYWITLADKAMDGLTASAAAGAALEFQSQPQKIALVFVGIPGLGKSTVAAELQRLSPLTTETVSQDEVMGKRQAFMDALTDASADMVIIDRNNHTPKHRKDVARALVDRQIIFVDFTNGGSVQSLKTLAVDRISSRGPGHPTLWWSPKLFDVLTKFETDFEVLDDTLNVCRVDPAQPTASIVALIFRYLGLAPVVVPRNAELTAPLHNEAVPIALIVSLRTQDVVNACGACFCTKGEYHVTLNHNPDSVALEMFQPLSGCDVNVQLLNLYDNQHATAVRVRVDGLPNTQACTLDSDTHHITLAVKGATKPVYCKALVADAECAKQCLNKELQGKLRVWYSNPDLGRALVHLLRHTAIEDQVPCDRNGGWVTVANLHVCKRMSPWHNLELADFAKRCERVVRTDSKGRLRITTDGMAICAQQGHSFDVGLSTLEKLTIENLGLHSISETVYHGTNEAAWDAIQATGGLRRMRRLHVHMHPERAGVRNGSTVVLSVHLHNAIKEGFDFFLSGNGVVLAPHVPLAFLKA
jgi:RNA:NAD 2'-phosphotransferase (TPT1/KptA family)